MSDVSPRPEPERLPPLPPVGSDTAFWDGFIAEFNRTTANLEGWRLGRLRPTRDAIEDLIPDPRYL